MKMWMKISFMKRYLQISHENPQRKSLEKSWSCHPKKPISSTKSFECRRKSMNIFKNPWESMRIYKHPWPWKSFLHFFRMENNGPIWGWIGVAIWLIYDSLPWIANIEQGHQGARFPYQLVPSNFRLKTGAIAEHHWYLPLFGTNFIECVPIWWIHLVRGANNFLPHWHTNKKKTLHDCDQKEQERRNPAIIHLWKSAESAPRRSVSIGVKSESLLLQIRS